MRRVPRITPAAAYTRSPVHLEKTIKCLTRKECAGRPTHCPRSLRFFKGGHPCLLGQSVPHPSHKHTHRFSQNPEHGPVWPRARGRPVNSKGVPRAANVP
ncbi:hypothetical protein CBL_12381 [Carabus blaptoides fortunei]